MQSFEMKHLSLVAITIFSLILGANAFSYKDAENWGKKYPQCNGRHQSPILFKRTSPFDYPNNKKATIIRNFDKLPKKLTIKNTGHTVEITADWSGAPPKISSGPLNGTYVLGKTTFHWAQKKWANEEFEDYVPPEFLLLDMEMHMYFYRTDLKSFDKAETQKGGIAVVSMGLKSAHDEPDHLFDTLERNLHKVRYPNSTAEIPPFRFTSIFNKSNEVPFHYYEGSLDYPPCLESVPWFESNTNNDITDGLINELRKIKLAEGDVSNVRPHQPVNGRPLSFVYNNEEDMYSSRWVASKL